MATDKKLEKIISVYGPVIEVFPLVEQLELAEIRLLESASTLKLGVGNPCVTRIMQSVNIGFSRHNEPARIAYQYAITVSGVSDNETEIIRISAKFGEMYRVKSDETFADEAVEKYGQLVGLNAVWTYWREFVQSITTRMGLPPLTLPIVRPGSLQFTKNQKEGNKPKKPAKQAKRVNK